MDEKPNYYAIIPANVRYDKRLKAMERLLYAEITALCNKEGYCWATNSYFANLYETAKETISRYISHLTICGYIKTEIIKDEKKNIEKRVIQLSRGIDETVNPPIDETVNPPIDETVKENNININNTSININRGIDNKFDPFIKQNTDIYFCKEYEKILNHKPILLMNARNKLNELDRQIENFRETVPEVLNKLKYIKFEKCNVIINYLWLLKDDNYIKVLSGYFDNNIKKNKEDEKIMKEMEKRNAKN